MNPLIEHLPSKDGSFLPRLENQYPARPRPIAGDDLHQTLRWEKGIERNKTASTIREIAVFAPR
jgi:hypothetical protein